MAMILPFQALKLVLILLSIGKVASSASFTLRSQCTYTVWSGTLSGNGPVLGGGGSELPPGSSIRLTAPSGWSGRFWGRTGCSFNRTTGAGNCSTGDCGGLKCTGGGVPPVTLVEFTLAASPADKDFYDVSLVDGYNIGMGVRPTGGTGDCQEAGCREGLNRRCPPELRVVDSATGKVVGCKSACLAFGRPEFCCTGDHSTPQTCTPSNYSAIFKAACPTAYSYPYDDATSICTCSGTDYVITFCPTN
ncbi:hypothetical protein SAY86_028697 [Trapa natans]|uniref:Thaumatin-like protein n=1 Tax=Trapa natans TaxID=22666 RepID=A0AAN7MIV1_TRANT|nr:hypothetical protein SAY86_028697 [Trapa natans]